MNGTRFASFSVYFINGTIVRLIAQPFSRVLRSISSSASLLYADGDGVISDYVMKKQMHMANRKPNLEFNSNIITMKCNAMRYCWPEDWIIGQLHSQSSVGSACNFCSDEG